MFRKLFSSKKFIYLAILFEIIILFSLATTDIFFENPLSEIFLGVQNNSDNNTKSPKIDTASKPSDLVAVNSITPEPTVSSPSPTLKISTPTPTTKPTIAIATTLRPSTAKSTTSTVPVMTGLPRRFIIPKLGINTSVEHVGLDSAGRMDVPKSFWTVGWYKLGYKIGDSGSAVIAGHYDTYSGGPAVFWGISRLTPGDTITVVDTGGITHTFTVRDKKVYPYDGFPTKEVFGTGGTPGLNLITCAGEWDSVAKNYSTRTVVYASK